MRSASLTVVVQVASLTAALLIFAPSGCSQGAIVIGSDTSGDPGGVGLGGADDSGVDKGIALKDLAPGETEAWCNWFSRAFPFAGPPLPEDQPVNPDGSVTGYGAIGCETAQVCTVHLSQHHCMASLSLRPCAATIAELEECLGLMWGLCHLGDQRCDAFVGTPSCLGIIVQRMDDPAAHPLCPIQVQ